MGPITVLRPDLPAPPQETLELFVFLVVAITISQLLGAAQAGLARARAREREARHLNELTTALLGQTDLGSISRTIADRILLTLPGAEVGIVLQPSGGSPGTEIHLPTPSQPRQSRPSLSLPIQGMRGLLGEILIWKPRSGIPAEVEQLMDTTRWVRDHYSWDRVMGTYLTALTDVTSRAPST